MAGKRLTVQERRVIENGLVVGLTQRQIAAVLDRSPSTICRELARNHNWWHGPSSPLRHTARRRQLAAYRYCYRADSAHRRATRRARRPKTRRLADPRLWQVVTDLLRRDWSPQQIAAMLPTMFPDQPGMRVSHETIYHTLFVQTRGQLRRELTAHLRTGRTSRKPRGGAAHRHGPILAPIPISARPASVQDRAVPGHWEGDLLLGARGPEADHGTRASMYGIVPLTYSRDHPGPLARDALDAAIMLSAMAGEDPNDPRTQGLPPVPDLISAATPVAGGVAGRLRWPTRIGVIPGYRSGTSATAAARRAFLDTMSSVEGATVVDVTLPDEWDLLTGNEFNNVRLPERSEPFNPFLREDLKLFGVSVTSWLQGVILGSDEYVTGQRAKLLLLLERVLDDLFAQCDVVVQTNPVPFDIIGLPELALPIGFSGSVPIGTILGGAPRSSASSAPSWPSSTTNGPRAAATSASTYSPSPGWP